MALTPLVELGVAEAYEILTTHFHIHDLPPLDSIENEDWGRDYLLSRFLELSRAALVEAGLCVDGSEDAMAEPPDGNARAEPRCVTGGPPSGGGPLCS